MRFSVLTVLMCLVAQPNEGLADYPCACNYHPSLSVYGTPSTFTMPVGYLYKAECKALVKQDDLNKDWTAIAMSHQVVYIRQDYMIHIETCPGEPNPSDKLISTPTSTSLPPSSTPLALSTQQPQNFPSSTYSPDITKATVKSTDKPLVSNHFTDQPMTPIPTSAAISGDISQCPESIQLLAETSNGAITQYGSHCLHLVLSDVIWQDAEWMCRSNGGHLVEIYDQAENDFLKRFVSMRTYFPVWIGLHDTVSEEDFRWTSEPDKQVTYINWNPNHHTDQHGEEDCAVFGPDGHWDDRRCGHYATVDNLAIKYGYVCQYDVKSTDLFPVG